MFRRHSALLSFACVAAGAGAGLAFWGWPEPNRLFEFSGLMLAAVLAAGFAARPAQVDDWTLASPASVVVIGALLMLGPDAATVVALTTAIALVIGQPRGICRALGQIATAAAAMQAAGFAHAALRGTRDSFEWPAQAVPIGAAILSFCLVTWIAADILTPLIAKQRPDRQSLKRLLRGCSHHVIGASVAVGLVEIITRRAWGILPVAAVPTVLGYLVYRSHVARLNEEYRRNEVVAAFDHGMFVVDEGGRVTLWTDSLERLLGCARADAVGRSITDAVPALAKTIVPASLQTVLKARTPKAFAPVAVDAKLFEVRIVPVAGGATLLWQDITHRAQAELALKKSAEQLSLAADGANDGLWELDWRTKEMYFSGRWKALVGLAATSGPGRLDEWMERVHVDDAGSLRASLEAHSTGAADEFIHEHRLRHEDGSYRRFLCRGVSVRAAGRRLVRLAGSLTDVTERAIAQEQLRTVGAVDPLTGLANRSELVEGLRRRLEELKARKTRTRFAALYLDLDRFKIVNDSLGHLVGDELLKAVSRRLESCLRDGDSLARLGGDEFAILLNGLSGEEQANAIAFRIQKSLSAPFSIGGREVFTSASIGIAFGRVQHNSPEEIMRDADRAMYHAKASGKARHEMFDADMHARTQDRIGLESDLRRAVDALDFELHYQPIVLLGTGMCVGFESLIRWKRNGESISPATFIPMAEELGLIEPVGTWCLQQACAAFADWKRRFGGGSLEYITVNVSSRQLVQQNFLSLVERVVEDTGIRPCDLRLEITETALMDSPAAAARLLQELRDFGVKIYLDDFGTGYSSLSHLHRLPVDALKIDRSFVQSLELPDRPLIVESILALARTMNTSVVAEGIETPVQAHELDRLGCTHAQGYLFSRPVPREAAEKILAANQPLSPHKTATVLGFEPKIAASA